ncbi:MAG: ribosome maturation factor RimP [Gammaproteobacteria bacterium]
MSGQATGLETLLQPVVAGLGYQLWGIEQADGQLIRIYIDAEQGITLADCEAVSRQVSAVLDVEGPVRGGYTLEVSSPGLDRPLFSAAQFRRYLGEKVSLKLRGKIAGRNKLSGYLEAVDDTAVTVRSDEEEVYEIPLDVVRKANLIWQG